MLPDNSVGNAGITSGVNVTQHQVSPADDAFRHAFEACRVDPAEFDHRGHVRLAYIYLCEQPVEQAAASMKAALLGFLRHLGVDPMKYHETITRAWIMAVRHFMQNSPPCASADAFIDANPVLLDSRIMLSHYSAELLYSPAARADFVDPDIEQIPRYPSDR